MTNDAGGALSIDPTTGEIALDVSIAPQFSQQTGASNPFDGIDVGKFSAPTFADLDNDGDLDLLLGKERDGFDYHQNIGTSTNPIYAAAVQNPFVGNSSPTTSGKRNGSKNSSGTFSIS